MRRRIAILESMGYQRTDVGLVAFQRDLDDIAEPVLPKASQCAACGSKTSSSPGATCGAEAFGSSTTPQSSRAAMGRAWLCGGSRHCRRRVRRVAWLDRTNRIRLFEPVADCGRRSRVGDAGKLRCCADCRRCATGDDPSVREHHRRQRLRAGVVPLGRLHRIAQPWSIRSLKSRLMTSPRTRHLATP